MQLIKNIIGILNPKYFQTPQIKSGYARKAPTGLY